MWCLKIYNDPSLFLHLMLMFVLNFLVPRNRSLGLELQDVGPSLCWCIIHQISKHPTFPVYDNVQFARDGRKSRIQTHCISAAQALAQSITSLQRTDTNTHTHAHAHIHIHSHKYRQAHIHAHTPRLIPLPGSRGSPELIAFGNVEADPGLIPRPLLMLDAGC